MNGIELIKQERERQINKEGWSAEHDKQHTHGELAWVAVCYTAPTQVLKESRRQGGTIYFQDCFPCQWDKGWDKRDYDMKHDKPVDNESLPIHERIRNLVKAGALIAAEIDRLSNL